MKKKNYTRIVLIIVLMFSVQNLCKETKAFANTVEVLSFDQDDQGIYFRETSHPNIMRYYPVNRYMTVVKFPEDTSGPSKISVNLLSRRIDTSAMEQKFASNPGVNFLPANLKMSKTCDINSEIIVKHLVGISVIYDVVGKNLLVASDQILCSFSLFVERGYQDHVIENINLLLSKREIFNDLFSINFNKIESQAVVSWEDVFEQVKGKFTERKALNRDVATFVTGIAVGELESSKQWWLGASKKEQDRFVSEAVLKLYTPVNGNFLLNDAVDDSRFMEEKSSSFQVKI
ncbi:MAG: hypothetical protein KBD78_08990 [Oligoflexales bacterium]|nr:hypothetical protein [Oligoflexales bacterium]